MVDDLDGIIEFKDGVIEQLEDELGFTKESLDEANEKIVELKRQIQFERDQAVQQKQERRAIYEQRDEARRIAVMIGRHAHVKDELPEWMGRNEYQPENEPGA